MAQTEAKESVVVTAAEVFSKYMESIFRLLSSADIVA
jgi:hypothetical protein